jgi:hypothetical protein
MKKIMNTEALQREFENKYAKAVGMPDRGFGPVNTWEPEMQQIYFGFKLAHDMCGPSVWQINDGELKHAGVRFNRNGAYHTYFSTTTSVHIPEAHLADGGRMSYRIELDYENVSPVQYVDFSFVLYQGNEKDHAYFDQCMKEITDAWNPHYYSRTTFDSEKEEDRFTPVEDFKGTHCFMRFLMPHKAFIESMKRHGCFEGITQA